MSSEITYRFLTPDGEKICVMLSFDDDTYRIINDEDIDRPEWARLENHKCENCPLGAEVEWCPAALVMAQIVPKFRSYYSYEKVVVEVQTPSRKISANTTFQKALASLMGLALATSGCPRTRFLRPMARFHLPFSDEQETVFRSLSTHLLKSYVENQQSGEFREVDFDGLRESYKQVSIVNGFLADRVRSAVEEDAAINAVVTLDLFAAITPSDTDGGFKHIAGVFELESE